MTIQNIVGFGYIPHEIVGLPPSRSDLVKKVALTCLKESVASLFIGAAVAVFVPSAAGIALLTTAFTVQTVINAFFHSLSAYAQYKSVEPGNAKEFYKNLHVGCQHLAASVFAYATGINLQFLFHEMGHALIATLVYKNPELQMQIFPFSGGATIYFKHLNAIGKWLGAPRALCLLLVNGPAFTLLISTGLLVLSLKLQKSSPLLSSYLLSYSLLDFLNTARYAYSAIHTDPFYLLHDFVHLSLFGIPPIAATITILAIPQLILMGHYFLRGC